MRATLQKFFSSSKRYLLKNRINTKQAKDSQLFSSKILIAAKQHLHVMNLKIFATLP
ncbi:hypothetical protein ccbrp13_21480 [Ktedonobacteria bacterium brp13]|nr:hypothetical protein ccbrp13_21480 [Ktedonobacteria bacterium brp13]